MGLIAGLITAGTDESHPTIHTDHLNSVRIMEDSSTAANMEARLRHMNRRSYYRWILDLLLGVNARILYTKGHSETTSLPATLNNSADRHAAEAHRDRLTPNAPIPTFYMDPFTLFSRRDGWIEANIRNHVDGLFSRQTAQALELSPGLRMRRSLYDPAPPPEYPYTRALSCYSAVVQLYARSGQLPTAVRLHSRGKIQSDRCRFGCHTAIEDEHHIFVECPRFLPLRHDAREEVERVTSARCKELVETGVLDRDSAETINYTAKSLFHDESPIWPLDQSAFHLGLVPNVVRLIRDDDGPKQNPPLEIKRLAHYFASNWHLASIRLTGRIWGQVQRIMARQA
ncbi:hypothetical protein C0992_006444, partial [Termitomyces sp. T32_za158]